MLEAGHLVPAAVLIGTDGSDNLYAIDRVSGSYAVYPAVGLNKGECIVLGDSWDSFLRALSES
jgi:hypothetical protein